MAQATARSLAGLTNDLTDAELLELTNNGNRPELKKFLAALATTRSDGTFVTHLSDDEARARFPQFAEAVALWRKYATAMSYTGPVAWRIKEGFTLKTHAPKAGPCFDQLNYLKGWSLKNDEPTKNALVFWVPRIAEGSSGKTADEMMTLQAELRKQYKLPKNHCSSFGSIALNFALILAHFKRTGERMPLKYFYAASDTFHEVGYRLFAGDFHEYGLDCSYWAGRYGSGIVGCFLLGVETLGN
ncbi:hypothetical protein HY633_03595 [Candidatus Uhrbacteria bacterium]|nr:hypothetical protein [Candidatus Uhrbacteria bacterium]